MNKIVSDVVSCQNQIDSFFVNQRIALLLKQSNITKKFGVSPVVVMRFVFSLVFTGKNLYRYLHTPESVSDIGKDTVYRSFSFIGILLVLALFATEQYHKMP